MGTTKKTGKGQKTTKAKAPKAQAKTERVLPKSMTATATNQATTGGKYIATGRTTVRKGRAKVAKSAQATIGVNGRRVTGEAQATAEVMVTDAARKGAVKFDADIASDIGDATFKQAKLGIGLIEFGTRYNKATQDRSGYTVGIQALLDGGAGIDGQGALSIAAAINSRSFNRPELALVKRQQAFLAEVHDRLKVHGLVGREARAWITDRRKHHHLVGKARNVRVNAEASPVTPAEALNAMRDVAQRATKDGPAAHASRQRAFRAVIGSVAPWVTKKTAASEPLARALESLAADIRAA